MDTRDLMSKMAGYGYIDVNKYKELQDFLNQYYISFFGYLCGYHKYILYTINENNKTTLLSVFKRNDNRRFYYTTKRDDIYTLKFDVSNSDETLYKSEFKIDLKEEYKKTNHFDYLNKLNKNNINIEFGRSDTQKLIFTSTSIPTLNYIIYLFKNDVHIEELSGVINLYTLKNTVLNRNDYFLFGFDIEYIRSILLKIFDQNYLPKTNDELFTIIKYVFDNKKLYDQNNDYIKFAVDFFGFSFSQN